MGLGPKIWDPGVRKAPDFFLKRFFCSFLSVGFRILIFSILDLGHKSSGSAIPRKEKRNEIFCVDVLAVLFSFKGWRLLPEPGRPL